jgi:hypothetical protein
LGQPPLQDLAVRAGCIACSTATTPAAPWERPRRPPSSRPCSPKAPHTSTGHPLAPSQLFYTEAWANGTPELLPALCDPAVCYCDARGRAPDRFGLKGLADMIEEQCSSHPLLRIHLVRARALAQGRAWIADSSRSAAESRAFSYGGPPCCHCQPLNTKPAHRHHTPHTTHHSRL